VGIDSEGKAGEMATTDVRTRLVTDFVTACIGLVDEH